MMTQLTWRAMIVRLGFSQDATADIFNGQGINLINEWSNLDDDNINTLLHNVRKPCGVRPGEMIIFKAEINLHLIFFFVCHKHCTSKLVEYGDINVPKKVWIRISNRSLKIQQLT